MDILSEIKLPISAELSSFDKFFKDSLKSNIKLLDTILKYVIKRKGKQMRPLFVLLSASINGGVCERSFRGATFIELLHTASLIHDDVVDESLERRGFFSINALWKNKISVLMGDFLLSKGMLLALQNKDFDLLEIISETVKMMSEGELLQMEKARTLNIKEDIYFEVIRMKTASLIAASCAIGAASSNGSREMIDKMKMFGENAGIAFQIKDDLLDFGTTVTGKPKGADIKEKKLTLPLIFALKNAASSERKKIISLIYKDGKSKETFFTVKDFVTANGGFEYAIKKMEEYRDKAIGILKQFPENNSRNSLESLVNYSINRNK